MKMIYKTVTNVVGIEYRKDNAGKAFSLMDTDDSDNVKLVREPSNKYDHTIPRLRPLDKVFFYFHHHIYRFF